MKLDDRLKKIATGVSVADAIESYLGDGADEPSDLARATSDELLAIVEVMFLMAAVDGEISEEELGELRASLQAVTDIYGVRGLELDAVLVDLHGKLEREGWKARLGEACARVRTTDGKTFAFQLAAGVAFVDDFVAHAEAAAIDSLAQALGLPKDEAQGLLREVHDTLFGF